MVMDQISAELEIRYPLPDSYVKSVTMKHNNEPEPYFQFDGKDICRLKIFLNACMDTQWNCQYKNIPNNVTVDLYKLFEKLVLC